MRVQATTRTLLGLGLGLACSASCGGGAGGAGGSSDFVITEVSNGFGKLLPHQIAIKDENGQPTSQLVEITRVEQLIANVERTNPIRPPTEWPPEAKLPNSLEGNHFLYARFSQALDPKSVLSGAVADGPGAIGAGLQVQSVDPVTGAVTPISGVAFVGGQTYGPTVSTDPSRFQLQTWVQRNGDLLQAVLIEGETPGLGFPGTEAGTTFAGVAELVEPATFVFVVDTDGDLTTKETFPTGVQIQMKITTGARSLRNKAIEDIGLASSTVGADAIAPEVLVRGDTQDPVIEPGNGQQDVDPQTNIFVEFTEPIQVLFLGDLDDGTPPALSASVRVSFGPSSQRVQVPFTVAPVSIFDLTRFELVPIYDFPGTGPDIAGSTCAAGFGEVQITVNSNQFQDLLGNTNALAPSTSFTTREGPGLVNAPVTPDAVYIGRTGSNQGISVIDLNGFGQGTGNPTYDVLNPIVRGSSNFPNNPNVFLTGAQLIPPLAPGECTFDGGSEGPFALVKDSSLRDKLIGSPLIESVGDMALGHALDNTFSNEQPFGCQAGGGNICSQSGLKQIRLISGGPNTMASANIAALPIIKSDNGVENLASWAPHPNPPPLVFPPLCLSPLINALEPTSVDSIVPPVPIPANPPFIRPGPGLRQLLVPGPFPQGIPELGLPPQSSLSPELNSFFEGPSTPQPNIQLCHPYMMRQQIGQFLYLLDRVAGEVVVLNSNRFTVLDRIRLPDPTSFAMSPNLDFLAVTNEGSDQVLFIDVNPGSATFHTIVKSTSVGTGPTGIAWDGCNEDIFVCNQSEGTVSVLSSFTLDVRKTLRNQITRPIDVALTPRQTTFGFARGVYFGYILNQNGKVAVFESGPDGVNGIGFDDVIASLPFTFARPKALQVDPTNLNSAVWICHEIPLDVTGEPTGQRGGALSNVGLAGGTIGTIPLDVGLFGNPQIRDMQFGVFASIAEGANGLSGIPVDLAMDNMRNLSSLTNFATVFSPGFPLSYNGKSVVKLLGGAPLAGTAPTYLFAAVPNPGVVDVFSMASSAFDKVDADVFSDGANPIQAPNATVLMDYFRQ
jgi:hypothetical protein